MRDSAGLVQISRRDFRFHRGFPRGFLDFSESKRMYIYRVQLERVLSVR